MQERLVWEGRGGLPHELVTHQLRQYDQYEFGLELMLTEGRAVTGLYHRWWILSLGYSAQGTPSDAEVSEARGTLLQGALKLREQAEQQQLCLTEQR